MPTITEIMSRFDPRANGEMPLDEALAQQPVNANGSRLTEAQRDLITRTNADALERMSPQARAEHLDRLPEAERARVEAELARRQAARAVADSRNAFVIPASAPTNIEYNAQGIAVSSENGLSSMSIDYDGDGVGDVQVSTTANGGVVLTGIRGSVTLDSSWLNNAAGGAQINLISASPAILGQIADNAIATARALRLTQQVYQA